MKIDEMFSDTFPVKFRDSHMWVRMREDGVPELIRVEPLQNDRGMIVPHSVMVYVDDSPAVYMDRDVVDCILSSSSCAPLEKMLNYKHKIKN